MPEAAMNKYDSATGSENQIWTTGQCTPVQTVPIAHCSKQPTHYHLRIRVFAAYGGHAPNPLCGR